jgi:hypothetical protein
VLQNVELPFNRHVKGGVTSTCKNAKLKKSANVILKTC